MTVYCECGREKGQVYVDGIAYGWYCVDCKGEYLPEGYEIRYESNKRQTILEDFV